MGPKDVSNYCPISSLLLFSKILKRLIAAQITNHIISSNFDKHFLSDLKAGYTTKSALLNGSSHLHRSAEHDQGSIFILQLHNISNVINDITQHFNITQHYITTLHNFKHICSYSSHASFKISCIGDFSL